MNRPPRWTAPLGWMALHVLMIILLTAFAAFNATRERWGWMVLDMTLVVWNVRLFWTWADLRKRERRLGL